LAVASQMLGFGGRKRMRKREYTVVRGGGKSTRQGRKAGRERSCSNTTKVGTNSAQVSGELAGGGVARA